MKSLQIAQSRGLRRIAAALDVRVLLLVVCVIWLSGSVGNLPVVQAVDRLLFRLGGIVLRENVDTRDYVRIDVPTAEMQRFMHDPVSATALLSVMEQVQQAFTHGTALVLDAPLWREYAAQNFLLTHWHEISAGTEPETEQAIGSIAARMRVFVSMQASDRNLLAVVEKPDRQGPDWRQLLQAPGSWRDLLRDTLPKASIVYGASSVQANFQRLALPDNLERPLLWQVGSQVKADARLELFMRQRGLNNPEWMPDSGIQLRDHLLRTSANSGIYPRYSVSNIALPLQHYSLAQLSSQDVRRLLHEKTVVIAEENNIAADDLLYSVISLAGGYYVTSPDWLPLLHAALVLVLAIFFLLVPYCSLRLSTTLVVLLLVALLVAQQIFLLLHRLWLPSAEYMLGLLAGYVTMLLWCLRRCYYPLQLAAQEKQPQQRFSPAGENNDARPHGRFSWFANLFTAHPAARASRIDPALDVDDTLVGTAPMQATVRMSAAPARKQRQFLGRYQVQRELGRGAMGVVYLGFDPKIARQVAIKTLHYDQFDHGELPAVKERFFREAEAAGRLRHPNIVTIYDAGEEADLAYIAMDYVSGSSLAAHVRKGQLLDVEMVYWIMAQVADAVDYANSQGIVHRDIKPSNILYDAKTHEVKVADFGIARIMDGSATRTKTGDILGSPLYMAPEQLKGEGVSARSDVFSLGVTFYQLLTGELPFKGDNLANLSFQIVQGKYMPVDEVRPDLPDSARKITAKAMQKNPDNRYAMAGEMADALQRALSKEFA